MKETAAVLGITPRTVAFHKYQAMETLAVRSTAQLVRFAVESRLLGSVGN
jgi:DNA-binding CsgD family transcriptional regulator